MVCIHILPEEFIFFVAWLMIAHGGKRRLTDNRLHLLVISIIRKNFNRTSTVSASINQAGGAFNITGKSVDGEGTFTITNGTAEIGLHVVLGQMAQKQEVVIAGDKAGTENSLKITSQGDNTETEIIFTKEGK